MSEDNDIQKLLAPNLPPIAGTSYCVVDDGKVYVFDTSVQKVYVTTLDSHGIGAWKQKPCRQIEKQVLKKFNNMGFLP